MKGSDVNLVLLLILSTILLGGLLLAFVTKKNGPKKKVILQKFDSIKELSKRPAVSEAERRDIVIQADNITASALQCFYGNQSTFSDNLKKSKYLFQKDEYNRIWTAHKLRNKVVHEQFTPESGDIKEVIYIFTRCIGKLL